MSGLISKYNTVYKYINLSYLFRPQKHGHVLGEHNSGKTYSRTIIFAVRSAVAKFGVDFYKNVYSDWVERHMQCAACGGSYMYFVKEDIS